jgi:hypothetical protein
MAFLEPDISLIIDEALAGDAESRKAIGKML